MTAYTGLIAPTDIQPTHLQKLQDYLNYDVRTHHTNMDTAERLDLKDIRQAAAIDGVVCLHCGEGDGEDSLAAVQVGTAPEAGTRHRRVHSLRVSLLGQPHAQQQFLIARVRAQRIHPGF